MLSQQKNQSSLNSLEQAGCAPQDPQKRYDHELLYDRIHELKQPHEELAKFSTQRRRLYDRYRQLEAFRSLDPEGIQSMHHMLLRIFAKPNDITAMYERCEAQCKEDLEALEALFEKCWHSLSLWTRVSDEMRHRLRLLDSLDIRLTLLDQKKQKAEEQALSAQKERIAIAPLQNQPQDTIPDLPAVNDEAQKQSAITMPPDLAPAPKKQLSLENIFGPLQKNQEQVVMIKKNPTSHCIEKSTERNQPSSRKQHVPVAQNAEKKSSMSPLEKQEDNRRNSPRLRLATDITIGQDDHCFFTGFSENISSGGIFIATYESLPPKGSTYKLFFSLPNGEIIRSEVEVMWVRDFNEQTPDISPGFGCRFLQLSAMDQERINQYIAKEGSLFMLQEEELAA